MSFSSAFNNKIVITVVSVSYDLLSSVGSNQTYGIFEVKAFGRASSRYY